jgi:Ca2+-binding EF-hand superfamily protein
MSASALQQMQERMFKAGDKNGDGTISKDEMSQMQSSNKSQGSFSIDEIFSQIDSDNDGAITRLESDAALAKLSQQAQGAPPPGPPPGPPPSPGTDSSSGESQNSSDTAAIFDAMDTNKDGKVSLEELTAALEKAQSSLSTNSDPKSLIENLSSALQSGNISDAQEALTALQKDVSAHNGGQSNDPFSQDLQTLSDALQSGSMSDAQSIFAGIQDKLSARPPHGGNAEGMAQAQGSGSSQDPVADTLQALLDAIDKSSSTDSTSTSDTNATLKNILTIALQSYMQQSTNINSQSSANGSLLSSSV